VKQYLKFIAQLVATVLAGLAMAFHGDETVSAEEWINVILLVLGSVAVLGAGNFTTGVWEYMKFFVSAATAGLVLLASYVTAGQELESISNSQWVQVGLAALGAVGVVVLRGPTVERHTVV
jgi:drug/metabolite transporter (DMT)-like permease